MAVDYSQFKGKPFQVVSKLGVRYTGIFDHINQDDQTISLSQVYNHGTEDRPTARKLPGSEKTLGWVRFHTESIESLALVENYVPPGEEAPADPILASVSSSAPSAAQAPPPSSYPQRDQQPSASTSQPQRKQSFDLPPKPGNAAISAATALDRVQRSLHDLSTEDRPRRNNAPRPPAVPDAEFDFTKGTEKFEKEREAYKSNSGPSGDGEPVAGAEEVGEPEKPPHPSAVVQATSPSSEQGPSGSGKGSSAYVKSSFFDGLSTGTARVSRADERHRNFDTFGEAGGPAFNGGAPGGGFRGGRGSRGGGFGGQQRGGGAYGGQRGRGFSNGGGSGGGYRGRGGYRGGYGQEQGQQRQQEEL